LLGIYACPLLTALCTCAQLSNEYGSTSGSDTSSRRARAAHAELSMHLIPSLVWSTLLWALLLAFVIVLNVRLDSDNGTARACDDDNQPAVSWGSVWGVLLALEGLLLVYLGFAACYYKNAADAGSPLPRWARLVDVFVCCLSQTHVDEAIVGAAPGAGESGGGETAADEFGLVAAHASVPTLLNDCGACTACMHAGGTGRVRDFALYATVSGVFALLTAVLYLLLLALVIVSALALALLQCDLDTSLAMLLLAPWLLAAFAFGLAIAFAVEVGRAGASVRRASYIYWEIFAFCLGLLLLFIFTLLLSQYDGDAGDDAHVVFVPLYVLLAVYTLAFCLIALWSSWCGAWPHEAANPPETAAAAPAPAPAPRAAVVAAAAAMQRSGGGGGGYVQLREADFM
jgi:hypothetical protein